MIDDKIIEFIELQQEINKEDRRLLNEINEKLKELREFIIPLRRDISKELSEAKELVNKGKPPRKQPKKKDGS